MDRLELLLARARLPQVFFADFKFVLSRVQIYLIYQGTRASRALVPKQLSQKMKSHPFFIRISPTRSCAAWLPIPHLSSIPPLPPSLQLACDKRVHVDSFGRFSFQDRPLWRPPLEPSRRAARPARRNCGREFRVRRALEAHERSHGACGETGCTFAGSRAVLWLHAWEAHGGGRRGR